MEEPCVSTRRGFSDASHAKSRSTTAACEKRQNRADRGLIDADLGGGLIKQRVARKGQGQRGGYRMLLAFRTADRVVFLFGFAKNERANIAPDDLAKVRVVAEYWLAADASMIAAALKEELLIEVDDGG